MFFSLGDKYKQDNERKRLIKVKEEGNGEELHKRWERFYFEIKDLQLTHTITFQDIDYQRNKMFATSKSEEEIQSDIVSDALSFTKRISEKSTAIVGKVIGEDFYNQSIFFLDRNKDDTENVWTIEKKLFHNDIIEIHITEENSILKEEEETQNKNSQVGTFSFIDDKFYLELYVSNQEMIKLVNTINSNQTKKSSLNTRVSILAYHSNRESWANSLSNFDTGENLLLFSHSMCIIDRLSVTFDSQMSNDQMQNDQEQDSEDEELEEKEEQIDRLIRHNEMSLVEILDKFRNLTIALWALIVILIVKFFFF